MSTASVPQPVLAPASGRAVAAFVVGLASFFFCCHLPGPVACYLAVQERRAIRAGQASPAGDGYAMAGLVLGIISTALLIVGVLVACVWVVAFGGLAILAAATGH
jgi:hypothetical protein